MKRVIDLTLTYTHSFTGFSKESSKTMEKDGWNASTLTFYSHCGTHMDAPIHFNASEKTIDQISVENFIGKAWVVDIRHLGAKALITTAHIPNEIKKKFSPGDSLLFWSGWSAHVNTPKYRDELPRIDESLAHWCVAKKVKMIGVEPPSVADVNNLDEVTKIHKILLNDVLIIEGLTNLEQLQSNCVELIALPLKIGDGDGAPARVIAIEN